MTKRKPIGFHTDGTGIDRKVIPHFASMSHIGHKSKFVDPSREQVHAIRMRQTQSRKVKKSDMSLQDAYKRVEALLAEPKYESFVTRLGRDLEDPKVKLVLAQGLKDGLTFDEAIHTRNISKRSSHFLPIQREIDLSKSLTWVGKSPENVPLILNGGPVGPKNFGGSPIVTSKGRYIVDGHHRWSQVYMINPDAVLEGVVDLNIKKPESALRYSQLAIANLTGKVNVQTTTTGKNIYKMSTKDIKDEMTTHFTPAFYEAFYNTRPEQFKTKDDVHQYILSNIMQMRRQNKPATTISRSYMPQYDEAGTYTATSMLEKGASDTGKTVVEMRKQGL